MPDRKYNLIPLIHAVRTSPSMLRELLSIPRHLVVQTRDWGDIADSIPGIHAFAERKRALVERMTPAFRHYVENYTPALITISPVQGAFLFHLCELRKPHAILDLGSGFSSYVFREYARNRADTSVVSVDDAPYWLAETARFLETHDLPAGQLLTWDDYRASHASTDFDLIFMDAGDLPFRVQVLPELLTKVERGAWLVVDDFHVPAYRRSIYEHCARRGLRCYSLRKVTRTRLSHFALIAAR